MGGEEKFEIFLLPVICFSSGLIYIHLDQACSFRAKILQCGPIREWLEIKK